MQAETGDIRLAADRRHKTDRGMRHKTGKRQAASDWQETGDIRQAEAGDIR